jgi:hypothetical protein
MTLGLTSSPASRRGRIYRPPGSTGLIPKTEIYTILERAIAFSTFALLLFSYVALPAIKFAGQPLRGILAIGVLLFLLLAYPAIAERVFRRYLLLVALAGGLAVLGIFTSVVNGASLDVIIQTVLEVHLQTVVLVIVAGILAEICGPLACVVAIVGVIGASATVAVLQLVGFDAAWHLRQALGPLSHEELMPMVVDRRPTGLSYSAIQLSTQLCLAFAAFAGVRDKARKQTIGLRTADPAIVFALFVLVAASVVTATRSPILGSAIFLAVYMALRRGSWVPLAIAVGGALLYFAWPMILGVVQSNAPRVVRMDDNSAAARSVFVYYGTRLFLDNPLGYGFAFQSSDLWGGYWSDLYMMRGAKGAQLRALHNYPLSMVNIYGIGILLFVPLATRLLRQASPSLVFFVPYAVHVMFHNSGPFFSDTIIWFVIAAIAAGSKTSYPGASGSYSMPVRFDGASLASVEGSSTRSDPASRRRAW